MTDPTPDATSAFERFCAAGWNGSGMRPDISWERLCEIDPDAARIWRRGFAAGLRELREPAMPDSNVRAWLDVLLMDAPE